MVAENVLACFKIVQHDSDPAFDFFLLMKGPTFVIVPLELVYRVLQIHS